MSALASIALAAMAFGAPAAVPPPPPKVVTIKDDGSTVRLVVGQKLRVKLGRCGSCGEGYKVVKRPDPDVLRLDGHRVKTDPVCQPPCIGGPVTEIWRYTAVGRGETLLRIREYWRGERTGGKFELTLRVGRRRD